MILIKVVATKWGKLNEQAQTGGMAVRACLLALTFVIGLLGSSAVHAGCWPSDSFKIVCWIDTKGVDCSAHHALTSAKVVTYSYPSQSIYEFETTHWWTGPKETACPPNKTVKFSSVWDRETGKAEEKVSVGWSSWSRYVYCSNNPWTGQGPSTVPICSGPANDPNVGQPVTSAMLSQSQRLNLLQVQEPLHTRCLQVEPDPFSPKWLTGKPFVEVVVSHHEYQKIEWHRFFQEFYSSDGWKEVPAPKTKIPLFSTKKYTERRVATTTGRFWLNKQGRWKIVAIPKATSFAAQLVATTETNECPGALFNIQ
ncbi:hypothetical protein [Bradyrhizobium sp. RDT46]|uniref:hypothetical protein n=1 Tax=Bradyrhizobium sp. RDT46 TaxID=3341829 RepID=UPI0035C746BD